MSGKKNEVVIFAGGYGTRLGDYTIDVPKPLIPIGNTPILLHIMEYYASFGHTNFVIALGYKSEAFKDYFSNLVNRESDLEIDLGNETVKVLKKRKRNWRVKLIDTGINTLTGERLLKLRSIIENDTFMLTYGDGVSNIDINILENFHKKHGKIATVSAVRPPARFGELDIDKNSVKSFDEKPNLDKGWINGGFFVLNKKVFDFLKPGEMFESGPLSRLAENDQLAAFKHHGRWQCMDTKRDLETLNKLWEKGNAFWRR